MDRECKKKRALSRFFHCSFFSSLCIFFSCLPLSESLKLANFDQIQVAFKHWCYLNGEWGRKNEHGEGGNEKWEQSRELEMKLLIGLRFKAGFVPICHFPISRARPLLHVRPLPACRRLLFPLFPCATKEKGDVCTLATFPVLITSFWTLYFSSIGFFVL